MKDTKDKKQYRTKMVWRTNNLLSFVHGYPRIKSRVLALSGKGEGERESYFYGIIFQYFSLIANCDHLLYLTLLIVNSLLHYR